MKKLKPKNSKEKPVIHDQWIEIRKVDGIFVTTFYPPTEEFEQERLKMDPPPTLIYRRFNFVHGVPSAYQWTQPTSQVRELGGVFLQRIEAKNWPRVLQGDRLSNHQVATSSRSFVPRPECFGPCPCEECMAEERNANQSP